MIAKMPRRVFYVAGTDASYLDWLGDGGASTRDHCIYIYTVAAVEAFPCEEPLMRTLFCDVYF